MTIERRPKGRPFAFRCDAPACTVLQDTGRFDFRDALADIKRDGWAVYQINDQWRHNCPTHTARKTDDEDA